MTGGIDTEAKGVGDISVVIVTGIWKEVKNTPPKTKKATGNIANRFFVLTLEN